MLNRRTLLAATALVALSSAAYAQDETNWYAGAGFGANWLDDESVVITTAAPTTTIGAEFEAGWAMTGAVGHRWNNQWRLEFELGYRDNESEDLVVIPGPLADTMFADVTQFSQMINLLYDFPLGDNLALTLGGGVGGVQVQVDAGGLAGLSVIAFDDDDYVFAYQGIAGLSYDISDKMELFAEYRYFATDEVSVVGTLAPVGSILTVNEELESHSALFGVRYHFMESAPPPPPQQETVAPPPPKTYIVFFDFNKANLTSEAQGVVAEAAEAFRTTGSVRVQVIGHTDTVGSSSYNQKLSERRAATVKAEMVRLGIAEDAITTEGRGFSDPMVPTGAGVREPQNRRAVIELQ
jgi:opacity protein-like surface antigen